jgi:peptidoglycan hydrolase-like protein with peptidoglycan-binding domain
VPSRSPALPLTSPQRGLAMFAAAGVVAGALVGGVGATPAHAATSNATYFINAINAQRVAHGRARLAVDATMMASAQHWAEQMAKSNSLYHNPHLASSVSNWKYLGENVGVGYSDSSLESAFYASTPHRDNMLDKDFSQIGVAVVIVKGKYWVAEEFRRPMHSTAAPKVAHQSSKHAAATHHAKPASLTVGSRGSLVAVVQRLLHITADGMYGPQTKAAVENFQRHHHLKVTGTVGKQTLAALRD